MIHVRKRWLAHVGVNWTVVLRNKLGTYCSGPSESRDALDWFGGDRGDRKWMCWVYTQEVYLHRRCSQVPGWTSFEGQKILSLSSDTDKLTLSRMLAIEKANFPFLRLK